MTPRKSGAAAKPAQSPMTMNPWSMATDYGRQQLAVVTESAGAMARGFEAIRRVQEQAGHRALARHSSALAKLTHARDPAQLMALQSELLTIDTQNAARYWQELGAAAMEMQSEMLGCCNHLVDSDSMLQATAAMDEIPVWVDFANWFGVKPNGGARAAAAR